MTRNPIPLSPPTRFAPRRLSWLALVAAIGVSASGLACRERPEAGEHARSLPASAPEAGRPASGSPPAAPSASTPASTSASTPAADAGGFAGYSYADVVSRVAPAVVTIHSARRTREPQQFPFMSDPFFREFFGDRPQAPRGRGREVRGLGSGVIVSADGLCLTNHHVIDGAESISVELTDHRTFEAKVIGSDAASDLAVLKIDGRDLPRLTLGDSERVRVGDVALAIGNPLGVGQTVTAGIISAKGRYTGLSDGSFEDFLQTDAPINQGNSGGALVNGRGELVGINSQILSPSGVNIGIGFAIPSNMARNVMEQLVTNGKVRRGQLGVIVQPVTPDEAKRAGRADNRGVLVREVVDGGPAERAGVRAGDIITAFNGTPMDDSNSLRIQVASAQPGAAVTLTIWRDGKEQQVRVTLAELPPPQRRT
jgi:Do/DeqQ family serine protease